MRAVWYERHGAPHVVLHLGEMPTPDTGPDERRGLRQISRPAIGRIVGRALPIGVTRL